MRRHEKLGDLVALQARVIGVADHQLRIATAADLHRRTIEMAQTHFAHMGKRHLGIAGGGGGTATRGLDEPPVEIAGAGGFGNDAQIGIGVDAHPCLKAERGHGRAKFDFSSKRSRVFIDHDLERGDRPHALIGLGDDHGHGGRVMGAVGRIDGKDRTGAECLICVENVGAQIVPCLAILQRVARLFGKGCGAERQAQAKGGQGKSGHLGLRIGHTRTIGQYHGSDAGCINLW
ncbi:hypothetical protein RV134_250203 [Roseovarius sp. EC-HK134]|nr:hypothetical protein RV420_280183 [Roseovarius sp. EC-SD190]VVT06406.1 hypothetical protein RV134_250203 [Roseovarius sp. EC-HK134]